LLILAILLQAYQAFATNKYVSSPGASVGFCYSDVILPDSGTTNNVIDSSESPVTFSSLNPPTVSKNFNPNSIAANGISTMTITLGNTNAAPAIMLAPLVDKLPPEVQVAGFVSNTCGGVVTAILGTNIVVLTGGTIPVEGSCSVVVRVSSCIAGTYTNIIPPGALQTTVGNNTAPAQASLQVSSSSISQIISFATSFVNAMTFSIKPTFPPGSLPWSVQPGVTFLWKIIAKLFFSGGTNVPSSAKLFSSSCGAAFNGNSYCGLVGSNGGVPFVMQSFNGGTTWSTVTVPGLPAQGTMSAISCTTNPSGVSTCVGIGVDKTQVPNLPIAIQTTNSGTNWSIVLPFPMGSIANFSGVDCTSNASNTLCQIAGFDMDQGGSVIYNYTAALPFWLPNPLNQDVSSNATYISCASLPTSDISCLVGLQNNGTGPTLVRTFGTADGLTYTATPIVNPVTQGAGIVVNATACILNTSAVYCVAAGSNGTSPFLVQNTDLSNDNGWSLVPTAATGELLGASCVSFSNLPRCNAAGSTPNLATIPTPYIIATNDGASWSTQVVLNNGTLTGTYNTSSCTLSSGLPLCFVTGVDTANNPISADTLGGNASWQNISGITTIFTTM